MSPYKIKDERPNNFLTKLLSFLGIIMATVGTSHRRKGSFLVFLCLVIALAYTLILSQVVPFNDDEFIAYHSLACIFYPLNALNTFRLSCSDCYLNVLSLFTSSYKWELPLRSWEYVGAAQALPYFPLFLLWHSPYSARFFGILMLLVQTAMVAKLFKRNLLVCFLGLLLFLPYAFQHLVDTGQLSIQTTSIFLSLYFFQKWQEAIGQNSKRSWYFPLLIGLLFAFCLFNRLSYAFVLPGICFMLVALLVQTRSISLLNKTDFKHGVIFFLSFLLPTLILLYSQDRHGIPYIETIKDRAPLDYILSPLKVSSHFIDKLSYYFLNPMSALHATYSEQPCPTTLGVITALLFLLIFAIGISNKDTGKTNKRAAVITLIGGLITLLTISLSPASWAMHHIVLSYPFFILTYFYLSNGTRQNPLICLLLVIFLVVNASGYYLMQKMPLRTYKPFEHTVAVSDAEEINEYINQTASSDHIVVILDWGLYYLKSLYGPHGQSVLWISPLNSKEQITQIKKLAATLNRKILILHRTPSDSDLDLIHSEFPGMQELSVPNTGGLWKIESSS